MSTLAERVKDRMAKTGLTNAQLAAACKVKPPTSFNWASGKTKSIKGAPLLLAAAALGVTPGWLDSGKGQKFPAQSTEEQPSSAEYSIGNSRIDPWTAEIIALMTGLSDADKRAALANLKTFLQNLSGPTNGQTLPMAA